MVSRLSALHRGIGLTLIFTACAFAQVTTNRLSVIPSANDATVGEIRLWELRANGSNYVGVKAPASIAANKVWQWPSADAAGPLCSDGSLGLTFGGCAGLPMIDTTALVFGSSDSSKLFRIEVDGFTTGVTRVATPPDQNFTIAGLDVAQLFTSYQSIALSSTGTGLLGIRNTHASGYSGFDMTDSAGTSRGIIGWANASATNPSTMLIQPTQSGDTVTIAPHSVPTLVVGELTVNPPASGTVTLGDVSHKWLSAYMNTLEVYGASHFNNGSTLNFSSGSTLNINSGSTLNISTGLNLFSLLSIASSQALTGVMSLRNTDATGYSGFNMTDSGGTSQGVIGWANASATNPSTLLIQTEQNGTSVTVAPHLVPTLVIGELTVNPPASGTVTLGDAGHKWLSAYMNSLEVYGSSHLNNGATLNIQSGATVSFNSGSTLNVSTPLNLFSLLSIAAAQSGTGVLSLRNTDATGNSGFNMTDSAGTSRGTVGWSNASATNPSTLLIDASQTANTVTLASAGVPHLVVGGNLVNPAASGTFSLGDVSHKWLSMYANSVEIYGTSHVNNGGTLHVQSGGGLSINAGSTLSVAANYIPQSDSTYSIGDSTHQLNSVHMNGGLNIGSSGLINFLGGSGTFSLSYNGASAGVQMAGSFILSSSLTYGLGDVTHKWATLYVGSLSTYGSGFVTNGSALTVQNGATLNLSSGSTFNVTTNYIPTVDSTYNIGDASHYLNSLFASSAQIKQGGNITLNSASGNATITNSSGAISMNNLTVFQAGARLAGTMQMQSAGCCNIGGSTSPVATIWTQNLTVSGGNLVPSTDNISLLGDFTHQWNSVYTKFLIVDGGTGITQNLTCVAGQHVNHIEIKGGLIVNGVTCN